MEVFTEGAVTLDVNPFLHSPLLFSIFRGVERQFFLHQKILSKFIFQRDFVGDDVVFTVYVIVFAQTTSCLYFFLYLMRSCDSLVVVVAKKFVNE